MSRFTFWRKFGGKHVSTARPAIANGINLSAVKSFHSKDDMWDRGLSRNIRVNSSTGTTYDGVTLTGRNQVVVDPSPVSNPGNNRINASSNGLNVSNILGTSYGSIKMDYDGRIYPTNNLGINELIIRFAQWIEPGTVPNMRFLIDFQNPTAQIKAGSMIGFALDATAPGSGNLGNGKYVVILASEGVNVSRSLVIALSTVDSTGFLFRCTPCDINGNDPTGYTASGRISTPAFAARVNNAAMMVRCLDIDTINNDDVRGGDTLTHGTRTQEAWTESTLTKSQLIKLCNECSVGYHIQFAVYDDPTYVASVLANYVNINSPLVTVEYSNEPWNTGTFIHGAQTALEGSRLSFDIPIAVISGGSSNYATYTPAQVAALTPRPIRSYNLGSETTTSCDVASGEEYFTNVSGIGTLVAKARVARPLGSACVNKYSSSHAYTPGEVVIISSGAAYFFTATQSFTGTAPPVAWVSATTYNNGNIALGSDGNIYVVATGHGPTTGVNPVGDLTGTWVAATALNSPWLIATVANPNGANWTLTSNFTQTQIAGARYRMTRLKSFKAIADPIFAAAGKPRPKYMLNIQLNGSQTVGSSQILMHTRWDGGWDVMDDVKMAPYMGGDLALNNDLFWRTFPNANGGGTIGTLTPQLKMNLYDTTVVGDPGASGGVVDTLVANFAAQCDIIWDAQATNIAQQKVLLQAAALADGCPTFASKRIGTYENNQFGLITDLTVPSATKDRGPWPDDTAVAWSAAKTYNPSDGTTDTTTTFAYVGTELYRCLVTNTNVSPTSDPTKWGHVTKCSNGNPRWLEWYFRLMRDPAIGTMLRNFDIAVQARIGDGDWMRYQQYSALVGTVGSTIQFWGLQETGIDTANTRWQASVLTAADWRARA